MIGQRMLLLILGVGLAILPPVTCVRPTCWSIVSVTSASVEAPDNATLMEYFVLFARNGSYQAAVILTRAPISLNQLATFAPLCEAVHS